MAAATVTEKKERQRVQYMYFNEPKRYISVAYNMIAGRNPNRIKIIRYGAAIFTKSGDNAGGVCKRSTGREIALTRYVDHPVQVYVDELHMVCKLDISTIREVMREIIHHHGVCRRRRVKKRGPTHKCKYCNVDFDCCMIERVWEKSQCKCMWQSRGDFWCSGDCVMDSDM